jgi:hypothetical protein
MMTEKVLEPLEALQAMAERTRLRDSKQELATLMAAAKASEEVPRPSARDVVLELEPHEAVALDWSGEQIAALIAASTDREAGRRLLNALYGQYRDPDQRYTVFKATMLLHGLITQATFDAAPRYRPAPPVDRAQLAERAESQAIFEGFSRVVRRARDPGMAAQISNNLYGHKRTRGGLAEFTRQVKKDIGLSDGGDGQVTQRGRVTVDPMTGKAVKR